jgi:hypothetical protein
MSSALNGRANKSGFLDPFFAPFRRQRVPPSQTVGVSGTAVYGGFLQSNEKDARLQGRERYTTYSENLANTAIVGAGTRFFLNLVSKPTWKAEPADESAEAARLAEATEEALFDMSTPWHRVVRRAAMYRFYGFSIQEWTSTRLEDGSIGFLDCEPRPQMTIERWDLDESGTVHGVVQRSPQTQMELYLPRGKLVYACDDSLNDSPEGLGLFRHITESVRRLDRYLQLEGFGFETDLRGIPVGRGPFDELQRMVENNQITAAQKAQYEAGLREFVTNHVKTPDLAVLLDSKTYETTDDKKTPSSVRQWDVELLTAGSMGMEQVAAAIERLNREIARVLGVESLLLGSTGTGSLALSRDKSSNFALIVDSTLRELAETFEADLVDRLFELNGWNMDLRPTLKTDAVQMRDAGEITDALRSLGQAANAIGPQDEAFLEVFDLLGLTRPEITEDVIDAALGGGAVNDPNPSPDDEVPEAEGEAEAAAGEETPEAEEAAQE